MYNQDDEQTHKQPASADRPVLVPIRQRRRWRCRYQDIDEALDSVSHKVLTDTLTTPARRAGWSYVSWILVRVETTTLYQLTDLGRSLDEPLTALQRWFEANWPDIEEARRRWNQRSD